MRMKIKNSDHSHEYPFKARSKIYLDNINLYKSDFYILIRKK